MPRKNVRLGSARFVMNIGDFPVVPAGLGAGSTSTYSSPVGCRPLAEPLGVSIRIVPNRGAHPLMPSRRTFLGAAAMAGLAAARLRAQAPRAVSPSPNAPPDLVLVNGRIHTMDAQDRVVSRVSISTGRFTAIGDAAPSRAESPAPQVIDLRGRTAV